MKNIDLNNETLCKLRESLNKIIDDKIKKNKINERIEKINSLSFGELKKLFEGVSYKLINSVGGKKIIAKYANTLRENKNLKNMYRLYEGVVNTKNAQNPELLVNSLYLLSESIDKKDFKQQKGKLAKIVKDSVVESNIDSDEFDNILADNKELNESIDYIFNNKRTPKNINEHTNNMNSVINFVKSNIKESEDYGLVEKTSDDLVGELNESLGGLEEWEKKVVESIALCELSSSSESELFENYKSECVELIEEKIKNSTNLEEKSRFGVMKENLSKKMFNESKSTELILTLAELKNTLEGE